MVPVPSPIGRPADHRLHSGARGLQTAAADVGTLPAIATLALLLLALVWWSWGRWLDPLVDFGRELYLPWQITEGRVLYRDLASFNGPLSPYLNAVWFTVGGTSLRTLAIANMGLALAMSWLLFGLFRRFAPPAVALAAAALFVLQFSVSHPLPVGNYNFITPYSHELTHGILLTVIAMTLLARFMADGRTWALPAAGFAAGLVFMTKVEVAIAAWLGLVVTLVARQRQQSASVRAMATEWTQFLGAAAAPLAVAALVFAAAVPLPDAVRLLIEHWRIAVQPDVAAQLAALPFYRVITGTHDWLGNTASIVGWTAAYAALFVGAIAVSRVKVRGTPLLPSGAVAVVVAIAMVALGLFVDDRPARPLPLLTGFVLVLFTWGILIRRRGECGAALHLGWIVFAAALLAKMALNPRLTHYGFALAMPAMLNAVVILLYWLPERVRSRDTARAIQAATAGVLLIVCTANLVATSREFARKDVQVGRGGDVFRADDRGVVINAAIAALASTPGDDRSLVVLPEGVMINYLSRTPSPVRFVNFMPPELIIFGEAPILKALDDSPPRFIALVHKDTTEYGPRFFGRDYGTSLLQWVEQHYLPVRTFGAEPLLDERFGIMVFERKP
jgi:hypothetical protein